MTYLQFHLVFILPPILVLLWLARHDPAPLAGRLEPSGVRAWRAVALIVALALVYTTPWDNYLVARGVWGYPEERVLFTIGYVPVEEYLFFVLQPVLASLFLFLLARRAWAPPQASERARAAGRRLGTAGFLLLTLAGAFLLGDERGLYLGLILVWAAPVAALQWGVGGGELVAHRRLVTASVLIPSAYLWVADRIALALGIWSIEPRFTTGLRPFGLPIEEALFFLMTNVIVVQGVLLFVVLGRRLGGTWTR